ncbi:class I adenylate-forming enzyme family protein [Acuticoccus mangrovi]|uniref:AMP-binding protein n=1 Tax=Acuticoccus mangrovi TaxID=2796142 RepID=A0A934IUR8_9HYPH|nr:AMP-binding protein [Acuticoccus mangrovi]MBJ3778104.1 AMP-binding protein [Acuticoccus mangrovi]
MEMPQARTVSGLLIEQAERYGDIEALVGAGQRYTYASLWQRVRAFAKGLSTLGIGRGSRVAILMGNEPEWIIADLAICTLGGTMVAVNTWVTTRELAYILKHSDADGLVFADRFLKYDYVAMLGEIEPFAENVPRLKTLIHHGARGYGDSIPFDEIFERGRDVPDSVIDDAVAASLPDDIVYLLYTSGSTSTPKGVQIQNYGLIENMWALGNRMHVVPGDRLWLAVSLYWGLGCENALFNLLTHAGCVVLQSAFEPGEALRLIEEERCTLFYGTANMAQAMVEHPDFANRDTSSLRSGGTVGSPDQIARVIQLGAKEICHIYGLTETYGNCNVSDGRLDPPDKRHASVGRPLEGVVQRIVDRDTGEPVRTGEVGEVQVKRFVMCGYYKDEEKNREAYTEDGWFRTGDLGFYDEDGYLYFRGRIKEMIKTGGINVAPAEVEERLMAIPGIKLAYVVGVPDAVRDEVIGAVIIPEPGTTPDQTAISTRLKAELAAYKMPRRYCFIAERDLPLTTTGKVHKTKLPDLFASAD